MGRVDGKVAFITGAARGLGRSNAVRLAEEGADIIAIDICDQIDTVEFEMATREDLEVTVREVEACDRRIVAEVADVRSQAQLDAAVAKGLAEFGQIDIVSANAGIISFTNSWEMSEEVWQDMIDVNLTGVWHTVKAVLPSMIEAGKGGSIVLISSLSGVVGLENIGHYTAAKHGVVGIMRTLANEVGRYGIRANVICPGSTATPMMLNDRVYGLARPDLAEPTREDLEPAHAEWTSLDVALLEPQDMSNALLYLASDESRYVTGVTLPIDGGALNKFT